MYTQLVWLDYSIFRSTRRVIIPEMAHKEEGKPERVINQEKCCILVPAVVIDSSFSLDIAVCRLVNVSLKLKCC